MRTMMILLLAGLLLLGLACWRGTQNGTDNETRIAPALPDDLVKAWKDAGTTPTWMGASRGSAMLFDSGFEAGPSDFGRNHNIDQAVPAFRVYSWKEGAIAKLPKPTSPFGLNLFDWRVTPRSMKELAELEQLAMLELEPAEGTAEGLEHLGGLRNLTMLSIRGKHVTDKVLAGLGSLNHLTRLDLQPAGAGSHPRIDLHPIVRGTWEQGFTDDGLRHLAGLKGLTSLNLGYTKVTDKGMKHLAGLEGLTSLNLGYTKVTDEGMKHLAGLENLNNLRLVHTEITNAGLDHFVGLHKLTDLNLHSTKVTGGGARKLYDRMKTLDRVHMSGATWQRRGPWKEVKGGG